MISLTSRAVALHFLVPAVQCALGDIHLVVVSTHLVQHGLSICETVTAHCNPQCFTSTNGNTWFMKAVAGKSREDTRGYLLHDGAREMRF